MAKERAKFIQHLADRETDILLKKNRMTIGRNVSSDIVITEAGVSGHHATLEYRGGYYFLKDEGSTNGTFVDGKKISTYKLGGGEIVRLGHASKLEYQLIVGPTQQVLRLVPIAGGNPVDLKEGVTSVGRDGSSDIQVKSEYVSRSHATITVEDEEILVEDLGSSQGTFVNERQVERSRLRVGDVIRFADQRFRLVEEEVALRKPALVKGAVFGVAGLLVVVLITFLVLKAFQPSALEKIASELELGLVNYDRENYVSALEYFDRVVDLLELQEGVRPFGEEESFAGFDLVRDKLTATNRDRDFEAIYGDILEKRKSRGRMLTGVERRNFIESQVKVLTEAFGTKNKSYTGTFVDDVDKYIWQYQTRSKTTFHMLLRRSKEYLPYIKEKLQENNLPEIFAYVPAQESKYSPTAGSKAGAIGIWQFMPATGRDMGLRVDDKVDERTDPEKSTTAAIRYLRRLQGRFGTEDYLLSLAAYNWGLGNVQGLLSRVAESPEFDLRKDRNYWYLVEKNALPKETAEYVSRIYAFAILLKYPERFGF